MNSKIKDTLKSFADIFTLFIIISIFTAILNIFMHLIDDILKLENNIESIESSTRTHLFLIQNFSYEIITIIICLFVWKNIKRKSFSEIGLTKFKDHYLNLIHGLIIGFVSITLCLILISIFGDISISISDTFTFKEMIIYLLLYILVGFSEEILVRGYMISTFVSDRKLSKITILIITSLIFASLHLSNPSITPLSFINLFLAGASFAYMYFCTGSLWISIGTHITWNYFQGVIYGFNVSDLSDPSLLNITEPVKNIINGGDFGMEGSIICTIVNILQILYIWYIYRNKNSTLLQPVKRF
mgnify:CR=1 FL=1